MIGELEYTLLAAAQRLRDDAYGASIVREIEQTTRRRCSLGALYTTLDRLESKGLITTYMGDPTPERGGRAKRMIRVTGKGRRAASEFYSAIMGVTQGIAWEVSSERWSLAVD
jgi:DNA-binding PadR family transcriptional regulator